MVLLTAGVRPANPREVKLQCLEGWLGLVRALAQEAPVQLGGVVNQASHQRPLHLPTGFCQASSRPTHVLLLLCEHKPAGPGMCGSDSPPVSTCPGPPTHVLLCEH